MQYILLRKNEPILTFKYLKSGQLQIVETYDNTLLPLNIQEISNVYLKDWLSKRCISKSRRNLSKLYDVTGCNSVLELSFYNHSTNLVDFYWTKKEDESITWEDVDFRRNGYSESVGNMLLKKIAPFMSKNHLILIQMELLKKPGSELMGVIIYLSLEGLLFFKSHITK